MFVFSELVYENRTLGFLMGMRNESGVLYSIIISGSCCIDDGIWIHLVIIGMAKINEY